MKIIALVAHDNKKKDLIEWCDFNKGILFVIPYLQLAAQERRLLKNIFGN